MGQFDHWLGQHKEKKEVIIIVFKLNPGVNWDKTWGTSQVDHWLEST
jgi:hypothetical protein